MRTYAVLGNCVTSGLSRCVQFFDPEASVTGITVWNVPHQFGSLDQMLDRLRDFDVVFLFDYDHEAPFFWNVLAQTIAENLPRCIVFPKIVFTGYHPDQVVAVSRITGENITSPLTDTHSAIALYGFMKGLSHTKIRFFYCREVFEHLWYFRSWDESALALVSSAAAQAFQLDKRLLSWAQDGCFMHNIVHPKINVLADLAGEMMNRAGHRARWKLASYYVQDDLGEASIWPVYPEIGDYYNIEGEYIFKRAAATARSWPLYLSLDDFLVLSLEHYSRYTPEQINCPRVESWIEQDAI